MADKRFTAKEAALAVLKKAEEMLKGSDLAKKYEGFKAVEESARESGASDPAAVAAAAGRKKYGKTSFQHAAAEGHKLKGHKVKKSEDNPDEKEDAQLGEDVEHLCEDHMLANKAAERKEGHKLVQKSECMKCNYSKPTPATGQGTTLPASKAHDAWEMDKSELYGDLEKLEELFKAEDRDKHGGVDAGKEKVGYKSSKLGEEEKDQEEPSDSAFEVKGKDSKSSDDKRLGHTDDPDKNPKEKEEGNNAQPGSKPGVEADPGQDTPPIKGHHKLAKFIGRMEYKRSRKGSM